MKREQLPKPPEGYEWGIEISQDPTGAYGVYLHLDSNPPTGEYFHRGPFYSEQQVIEGAEKLMKDLGGVLDLRLED